MEFTLATTQMMFHPFPFLTLPNPDEAAFLSLSLRPEEKKLRGAEIA